MLMLASDGSKSHLPEEPNPCPASQRHADGQPRSGDLKDQVAVDVRHSRMPDGAQLLWHRGLEGDLSPGTPGHGEAQPRAEGAGATTACREGRNGPIQQERFARPPADGDGHGLSSPGQDDLGGRQDSSPPDPHQVRRQPPRDGHRQAQGSKFAEIVVQDPGYAESDWRLVQFAAWCIKEGIVLDPMNEKSQDALMGPLSLFGILSCEDLRALEQTASAGYPADNLKLKLPLSGKDKTKKEKAEPSTKELLEVIEDLKKQVEQVQLNQSAAAPQRNLDAAMEQKGLSVDMPDILDHEARPKDLRTLSKGFAKWLDDRIFETVYLQ